MSTLDLNGLRLGRTHGKWDAVIVGLLLVLGLYLPTSMAGDASKLLFGIDYLVCLALLLSLAFRARGVPSFPSQVILLSTVPILLVFTFTSGFHDYSLGELAAFGLLSVLYVKNLRAVKFPEWLFRFCVLVNILNILIGIAILFSSKVVGEFLINHYSSYYPELVPNMLLLRKPVLTFATHSLAGLFFYLFFYISWQTYKLKRKSLFLIFALSYLLLTLALLSVSGLTLGFIGLIQLLYHQWVSIRHKWFWTFATITLVFLAGSFQLFDSVAPVLSKLADGGKVILMSPDNGILGRVMPGGSMYHGMLYLKEHPFSPVGAGAREGIIFADMGLIDYLLRGSVVLVVFVYGGLFFFLRRSLLLRSDFVFLFAAVVVFETGFSVLTYFRMLYLLPFFVVYLNGLRRVTISHQPWQPDATLR